MKMSKIVGLCIVFALAIVTAHAAQYANESFFEEFINTYDDSFDDGTFTVAFDDATFVPYSLVIPIDAGSNQLLLPLK